MKTLLLRFIKLACILGLLFLTSCFAKAKGPSFRTEHIFSYDKAVVYIYRPWKLTGIAASHDIYINRKKAFSLANASYYVLKLSPGKYTLGSSLNNSSSGDDAAFEFKEGETYFIRWALSVDMSAVILSGGVYTDTGGSFSQKTYDEAIPEIRKCRKALTKPGYSKF